MVFLPRWGRGRGKRQEDLKLRGWIRKKTESEEEEGRGGTSYKSTLKPLERWSWQRALVVIVSLNTLKWSSWLGKLGWIPRSTTTFDVWVTKPTFQPLVDLFRTTSTWSNNNFPRTIGYRSNSANFQQHCFQSSFTILFFDSWEQIIRY